MEIRVETLGPDGEEFNVTLDHEWLMARWSYPGEMRAWKFRKLNAEVKLTPAFGGIDLCGEVDLALDLECGRCLEPLSFCRKESVACRFEKPTAMVADLELVDSDFGILDFDGEKIFLREWLADQIALLIPDHPRCEAFGQANCGSATLDQKDEGKRLSLKEAFAKLG